METISLPIAALIAVTAFALGAGLCFVLMHMRYGGLMHEATQRTDRAMKARHQANELLLQARRQIELLNKEVELARRLRAAPKPAPAEVAPTLADDDAPTLVMKRTANGFADTQPYMPSKT
jgi:hypothetical protein